MEKPMHYTRRISTAGFTLPELLITVSILGILSSVATPAMLKQLDKSRQGEAETLISQLMTQASAFNDEFGKAAESWSDLDEIATITTKDGTANEANFSAITTSSGNYSIATTKTNNSYVFVATPKDTGSAKYNVIGCMNVATGASQVISGGNQGAANTSELKC
jgi:prepilin-type N-terminal cleavage/methylation domain-containing protein